MTEAASDLAPFVAAIRARRSALVDRMFEACMRVASEGLKSFSEAYKPQLGEDIDAHIAILGDPRSTALMARVNHWITGAIQLGHSPEIMLAVAREATEVLLEVGLELHAEGVPEASEGIRRLMANQSRVGLAFQEVYRVRDAKVRREARVFETIAHHAPDGIGYANMEGNLLYANPAFAEMLGFDPVGRPITSLAVPEEQERARMEVAASVLGEGSWSGAIHYARADGTALESHLTAFLVRDAEGRGTARCAILRDMGPSRAAIWEQQRLADALLEAQASALAELSTPIVPIAAGVVAMPLIGTMEAARADRMLDVLLDGIERESARVAILDITGVTSATSRRWPPWGTVCAMRWGG